MNLPNRRFGWMLALALVPPLAIALPEDRNQPIQLEASRGQIDQKTGVSVYEGNVVISQGSMRLNADVATIHIKDGGFQRMEATGNRSTCATDRRRTSRKFSAPASGWNTMSPAPR